MVGNISEPSSSISFASSNGSTSFFSTGPTTAAINNQSPPPTSPPVIAGDISGTGANLEVIGLERLSVNLESLLIRSDDKFDYTDAEIIVDGGSAVAVHRCILAARSPFFREFFSKTTSAPTINSSNSNSGGKIKYRMSELVPKGKVGQEALIVFLRYVYTGRFQPLPLEVTTCVDPTCVHDSCRPVINLAVEIMYISCVFQIPELVNLFQRQLNNFVDKAHVEDVVPILLVAFHCNLSELLSHCVYRVARSDLDNTSLEKELPSEVVGDVKVIRKKNQQNKSEVRDSVCEKSMKRIQKALDSDDVELVKMLLTESNITLDDAYALHYAVAYCDTKIVSELLDLKPVDVNLKNERGYTPLHVAAMRMEPAVIVSLLSRGASASELTSDGQSAVTICRRSTKVKDYYAKTERGQESNKDRVCIDILEREIRRIPANMEEAVTSPLFADDLHMKLIYLENRVAFARLLFPSEAKVAMQIAHADTTAEFAGLSALRSSGNLKEVDLNETPSMQNKRLRERVDALSRTVELGRRYFPHCSEVLDKFMDDDMQDFIYLDTGTPDEQQVKRRRFYELKKDVQRAFTKDRAESSHSCLTSSLSSSSLKGVGRQHKGSRK